MKPILIVGSIFALLIVAKLLFWKEKEAAPSKRERLKDLRPLKVQVLSVQLSTSDLMVTASGTLYPNEEVELRPEVSGLLVDLRLAEGAAVSKGQLIAKIKDDDIRAQLKKIAIEEQLARQVEDRQKKLLAIEAISKEEYDISMNKLNTLQADKELLLVQLKRTEVRVPFSGKLGLKNISNGAYVTPNSVIANIVQINPLKIDFSIPEKYLTKVKLGSEISLEIDGFKEKYSAKIIAIDPKVDQTLRTLRVRGITQNPGGRLLPGMFVNVELRLNSEESVTIPSETIIPVLEGKKVLVKRNGLVAEVFIETGLRGEKHVQVLSELSAGDSLITSALMTLKPGMSVTAN